LRFTSLLGRQAAERRFDQAGFLLIEAVAVLAISAVILTGLASILGLALRSGDRVASSVEALEMDTRAVATLRRELQRLARARWAGQAKRSFIFIGEPDRIMFAQSVRKPGMLASAAVVVVQSVAKKSGGGLLHAEANLPPGVTSQEELKFKPAREFYNGHSIFRFAYFSRAENGTETLVETWPSNTTLPSAIRIGLFDAATGGLLSTVRVPILIEAEPGCAAPKVAFCSRASQKEEVRNEDGQVPNGRSRPREEQR
jgi:general secretion pathway protein J